MIPIKLPAVCTWTLFYPTSFQGGHWPFKTWWSEACRCGVLPRPTQPVNPEVSSNTQQADPLANTHNHHPTLLFQAFPAIHWKIKLIAVDCVQNKGPGGGTLPYSMEYSSVVSSNAILVWKKPFLSLSCESWKRPLARRVYTWAHGLPCRAWRLGGVLERPVGSHQPDKEHPSLGHTASASSPWSSGGWGASSAHLTLLLLSGHRNKPRIASQALLGGDSSEPPGLSFTSTGRPRAGDVPGSSRVSPATLGQFHGPSHFCQTSVCRLSPSLA